MIIAVTGLAREERILRGPGIATSRRGLNLDGLLNEDVEGVISIGIAAALDPTLRVGDCVIGSGIIDREIVTETAPHWFAALRQRLPTARFGVAAGSDTVLGTAQEKSLLHARTGAIAADMESHLAARAAARADLPVAVLRFISDEADRALPTAAVAAMRADGTIDIGAVIGSILANPAQIGALMRTARDADAAFSALLGCRRALGPRLAFPDLS